MDNEEWFPDKEFRSMADAGLLGVTVLPSLVGVAWMFCINVLCGSLAY